MEKWSFSKWIDTFISEKGIDTDECFEVKGKEDSVHIFDYGFVIECIKKTSDREKEAIKKQLIKIDFVNGNVRDFLQYLANALVY